MNIRKQPFGYRIESGKTVVDPMEAEVVNIIFKQYLLGLSFSEITLLLKAQPVVYGTGRLWNKNMVARILGDKRYLGDSSYPPLIASSEFMAVTERRSARAVPNMPSQEQKLLRRLCKGRPSPAAEHDVLILLNRLISEPEIIQTPKRIAQVDPLPNMRAELETVMSIQPIDEAKANRLIYEIAAAQYAMINNNEYETERLRRMFSAMESLEELNAELLLRSISAISISDGTTSLTLKNGQVICGSDVDERPCASSHNNTGEA